MSHVSDIVRNRDLFYVEEGSTVADVARRMAELHVGAILVLNGDQLRGVFSERDLMKRVVVEGLDPATTRVCDVMTENPLTVEPHTDMENCRQLMRRHGFRHLPVCEGKKLRGLVSLRDIVLHDLSEKDDEVRMMRAYIQS